MNISRRDNAPDNAALINFTNLRLAGTTMDFARR